jgi:cyclohexyl-isocyanide hydratase
MNHDRRHLMMGMTGAAALAPFLALERAMAAKGAVSHHLSGDMTQDEMMALYQKQMTDLFGDNLRKSEEVAMLIYPGFTALDLAGAALFLRVHVWREGPSGHDRGGSGTRCV